MEVSVFSVLVCLFTFLFFLVSEVLGNTELAKEVTGVAGVQSCYSVNICLFMTGVGTLCCSCSSVLALGIQN